jgi:hypothetical protein
MGLFAYQTRISARRPTFNLEITMSAAETPMPAEPKLSEIERITNIFTSPSKTFADLRRSALWVTPWLLSAAFSLVFVFTVGQKVGWEQVMENNLRMAPASQQEQMERVPADQRETMMKRQVMVTKGFSFGFPVLSLIWLVVVALVLWGTFSFGAGADIKFGQALAILVFSSLPGIIKSMLGIVSLYGGMSTDSFITRWGQTWVSI